MIRRILSLSILLGLAGALSMPVFAEDVSQGDPEGQEKCYGIAKKGENDGLGNEINPASSVKDYQGNAWNYVKTGTCTAREIADGRKGSLSPLGRDLP